MNRDKICISANEDFGIPITDQINLFKEIGFDGFFTMFDDYVLEYKKLADEIGLIYHSIHAPFEHIDKMWLGKEEAKEVLDELLKCIKTAHAIGVNTIVCHAYIGFEENEGPSEIGLENFKIIIDEALNNNINIAFENTEGEDYLEALLNRFKNYKNVGFCLDTGHQRCYNHNKDLMSIYGNQIMYVHLNDNNGISDVKGRITWLDDLHLLPFDGIVDWESVMSDLNHYHYEDCLVLEINKKSKPGRHENDIYTKMPLKEYLSLAYKRAKKLMDIRNKRLIGLKQIHSFDRKLFPIEVTEHQEIWKKWYIEESQYIQNLLKDKEVYRISHVGSTSINNIKSKPIIDILIEIPLKYQFIEIGSILEENGYQKMYDLPTRLILNKGYTDKGYKEKVFHVHIVYKGDNDILYYRDYLNDHPEIAKEYERLKVRLSKKYHYNHDAYTEAKGKFVLKYTKIAKKIYEGRYN